jgi:threonine synthase
MHYFSTRRNSPNATFREAVELGQPRDGGLFFPSEIPRLSGDVLSNLGSLSNAEVAFEIVRPYVGGEIPDSELFEICSASVDFPFPLVEVGPRIHALELFHGPSLAFKDVGARFMSRCLEFFSKDRTEKTLVIVATSGDTGGAVAAGFEGLAGVEVVILYPKGRVSSFQENQLTEARPNVTTLEVRGSFDQCQSLSKRALSDVDLRKDAFLTSANSINVARWLPQQFYYAFALKNWGGTTPIFSVPSGNFGNIAAGLLIRASGLPISWFIAACNANDTVPKFFETGKFEPKLSVATLSNAMDVGDPSNFPRVLEVFGQDVSRLRSVLNAVTVSDTETEETMRRVFDEHKYVLDPHGAVAYRALSDSLSAEPLGNGIFLETAHPAKFESVERILGNYAVVPELGSDSNPTKRSTEISPEYEELREVLRSLI